MGKVSSLIDEMSNELDMAVEKDGHVKSFILKEATNGTANPPPARGFGTGGMRQQQRQGQSSADIARRSVQNQYIMGQGKLPFEQIREGVYFKGYNPSIPYTLMWGNRELRGIFKRKSSGHEGISSVVGIYPKNMTDLYEMVVSYNTTGYPFKDDRDFHICMNSEETGSRFGTQAENTILDPTAVKSVTDARRSDDGASEKLAKKQFAATMYWLYLVASCETTSPNPSTAAYLENPNVLKEFIDSERSAFEGYYKQLQNGRVPECLIDMDLFRGMDGSLTNTPLANNEPQNNGPENQEGTEGSPTNPAGGSPESTGGGTGSVGGVPTTESIEWKFDSMCQKVEEGLSFYGFNIGMPKFHRQQKSGWMQQDPDKYTGGTGGNDGTGGVNVTEEQKQEAHKTSIQSVRDSLGKIGGMFNEFLDGNPEGFYKDRVEDVMAGLNYMYTGGMAQLMGARPSVLSRWFISEDDQNLWYGINHYPAPVTGWASGGRPVMSVLARLYYMSDKQLTFWQRLKYFSQLFGTAKRGGVQHF